MHPPLSETFLAALGGEEPAIVPRRRFVYPEFQQVVIGGEAARLLDVAAHLGRSADVLSAYEVDGDHYTGQYAPDGMQRITDALGRATAFANQPGSEPMVDMSTAVHLTPTPIEAS